MTPNMRTLRTKGYSLEDAAKIDQFHIDREREGTAVCWHCNKEWPSADFRRKHGTRCRRCYAAYRTKTRRSLPHPPLTKEQKFRLGVRSKLRTAVKKGQVIRSQVCEKCGSGDRIEAHHYRGYEFPFDVEWLCKWCHAAQHRKAA